MVYNGCCVPAARTVRSWVLGFRPIVSGQAGKLELQREFHHVRCPGCIKAMNCGEIRGLILLSIILNTLSVEARLLNPASRILKNLQLNSWNIFSLLSGVQVEPERISVSGQILKQMFGIPECGQLLQTMKKMMIVDMLIKMILIPVAAMLITVTAVAVSIVAFFYLFIRLKKSESRPDLVWSTRILSPKRPRGVGSFRCGLETLRQFSISCRSLNLNPVHFNLVK